MRGRSSKFCFFNTRTCHVAAGGALAAGVIYGVYHNDGLRNQARKAVEKTVGMLPESVSEWRERSLRAALFENEGIEYVPNDIDGKKVVLLRGENHYDVDEKGYQAIINDILQNGRNPRVVRASNAGPFFRKLRGGYFVANVRNVESGETVLPYYTSGVVSLSPDIGVAGMFSCGNNRLGLIIITVPKEYSLPISRNARMNKFRAVETDDESHMLGHIIYNEYEYTMPRLHGEEVLAVCLVDTHNENQKVLRVHLNEHVMRNLDQSIVLDEQALEFIARRLRHCEDTGARKLVSYFDGQFQNQHLSLNKMYNAQAADDVAVAYGRALLDMKRVFDARNAKRKTRGLADLIMSPALEGVVCEQPLQNESLDAFMLRKMPSFLRVLNQTYALGDRRTPLEFSEKVLLALAETIDPNDYAKIHPMLIDVSVSDLVALRRLMQTMGISKEAINSLLGDTLRLYYRLHANHGADIAQAELFLIDRAQKLDMIHMSGNAAARVTMQKQ